MDRFRKALLLLVFVYFSAMMIVLGNGSSFLGRYLGQYFIPVANLVGLNTTWNFFSPDPAHTMQLRYTVFFEDEYGNPTEDAIQNYYPSEEDNKNLSTHVRRQNYMMRFFTASPDRLQKYFIPWVCRKYPKATRIHTEVILTRIPSLEVAATLSRFNYEDLLKQEEINQNVFSCL